LPGVLAVKEKHNKIVLIATNTGGAVSPESF
jgi:hypothetical protein